MTLANTLLALMWVGVTGYALLGGADFGAGAWDLLAGGTRSGAKRRALIEHSIGPVWEANHVWLIFVLVVMWTAFPPLFASVSSTLYIPLSLIAFGVIARGAANPAALQATTISVGVGIVLLAPSLALLFLLYQRDRPTGVTAGDETQAAAAATGDTGTAGDDTGG